MLAAIPQPKTMIVDRAELLLVKSHSPIREQRKEAIETRKNDAEVWSLNFRIVGALIPF